MRKVSLRLSVAFLFLSGLPLGCTPGTSSSGSGGSGGSSNRTGGSGGASFATGGSGGSATGGSTGGSGGSGGSATGGSTGGSGGSGGSATAGSGGSGGDMTGGTGGEATGGVGGTGGDATGGGGGTATGGGGGTSVKDGGADATGGNRSDAGDLGGSDALNDAATGGDDTVATGTCTDKAQNGDETDVDCGGGTCPKCGSGLKCKVDSDCRSGTCTSNKCADAFAASGTVAQVSTGSNIWRITLGTTILEVDQSQAAKIVTFSLDGTNMLVPVSAGGDATGSVFCTAPQGDADWTSSWPPPAEMYSSAYTPSSKDNILTMTGPKGSDNFSITKRFWGNVDHQTVTIEYTFTNGKSAAVMKAPWEITRVLPGGLTFFPNAEGAVRLGDPSFLPVPFTSAEGALWFNYQKSQFSQDIKGGADGLEGWAAHINCGANLEQTCASGAKSLILIKQWPDTTTQAPNEREVEIYANAGHNYVEFEQQGNYQSVAAGGTMVWTMHWMLRYLPSTVEPTAGSADLMTWVRGQLL